MAGNPRVVTEDTMVTWDGVRQRLARGTVIDVPQGSALEYAIGAGRLSSLAARAPQPPPAAAEPETEAEQEQAPPRPKARTAGKAAEGAGEDAEDAGGGDAM
jgi:hypothetical protein